MEDTKGTKLIYGVGINDNSCPSWLGGRRTKEYSTWVNMLQRAYSKSFQANNTTYAACTVSDSFKYYHIFHAWCQKQIGFGLEGYHLDKDFLLEGNKKYSEDTCCFIPRALNSLLVKQTNRKQPTGVEKRGNRYRAKCSIDGAQKSLGTYSTALEAFEAYAASKEADFKAKATLYKDDIDPRAYNALMCRKAKE
jgi:hypothetical protein